MYFINKKTCNKDARTYTHATAGYSSRPLSFISFVSGRWEKRKFARLFTYNEPSVVFPRWRDCNKLNKGKVNADTLTIVIENSGDYTEGEKKWTVLYGEPDDEDVNYGEFEWLLGWLWCCGFACGRRVAVLCHTSVVPVGKWLMHSYGWDKNSK